MSRIMFHITYLLSFVPLPDDELKRETEKTITSKRSFS
jgi:hypothetical protein